MDHKSLIAVISAHKFKIRGYKAADGGVFDIVVTRLAPGESYTNLVQRALGALPNLQKPEELPEAVWKQAWELQRLEWLKHMMENGEKVRSEQFNHVPLFDLIDPADPEAGITIPSVLCDRTLISGVRKEAKGDLAKAREILRNMLEIGKYVGKLILTPGKYEEVLLE